MSLNLGTPACEALRELNAHPKFAVFLNGVRELTCAMTNKALDAPPENALKASGYGQAMRDFYVAIEAAAKGTHQPAVKAPGAVKQGSN